MRNLNLVFQGGGVKGIAYAGVLQSLPTDCVIRGIGGTSAGALAAALVATGKRSDKLREILQDKRLFKLLEESEAERYGRFKFLYKFSQSDKYREASEELGQIWKDFKNPSFIGWRKLLLPARLRRFEEKYEDVLSKIPLAWSDLTNCWLKKGLHSSLRLRKWLDDVFEGKRFGDLPPNVDLRIMAANLSTRSYSIFETGQHKGYPISGAVHASVSVPIFFEPLTSGTECLVDGGLLSNFPHFLFAQVPYPTVGFELVENTPSMDCTTTFGFLSSLLGTMIAAHDKHRKKPPYFRSYQIRTPDYIPFDKFDLTEGDANELFYRGEAVGNKIPWTNDQHSSEKELVVYYDPLADQVLDSALQQAGELIEHHISRENWVDEIHQNVDFRLKVEETWSARYDRRDEIVVKGPKPLFLQRIILKVPKEVGKIHSLVDLKPVCVDNTGDEPLPLVYLPAFNGEDQKGFIVFYNPPISENELKARKIQTSVSMPDEFQEVGRGNRGDVSLSMTRRALKHKLQIKIEVWLHRSLPTVEFEVHFKMRDVKSSTSTNVLGGRRFDVHTWELPELFHEDIPFPLAISFKIVSDETGSSD